MSEVWKPFPGYEGWYEVSNLGRVRRVRPAYHSSVGRVMKLQTHKDGYVFADLCKEGEQKHLQVSRAVCTAFHGPSLGKECNHKDGVRANNKADNLEWVTASENQRHSYDVLGRKGNGGNPFPSKIGTNHPFSKHYLVTDPNGREFEVVGLKHFCRENNLHFPSMITIATGSGHLKTHHGWTCRYVP